VSPFNKIDRVTSPFQSPLENRAVAAPLARLSWTKIESERSTCLAFFLQIEKMEINKADVGSERRQQPSNKTGGAGGCSIDRVA
jgi:hypothetical protein